MKMKKSIWFLALCAALVLTACGGGAEPSGTNAAEGQEASGGTETQEAAEPSGAAAEEAPYVFALNGVEIPVDADAVPIMAALGKSEPDYRAASCAFEGEDKFYYLGSVEVDTYPMGEQDYVSYVILQDDLVSTPEGVSIGDDAAKVTAAYGEGADDNGTLVYARGGMKLCFVIQDGAVAAIEYRTTALD